MNPLALNENSVDSSIVEKETEIIKEQLVKEGRPENIIDNIIMENSRDSIRIIHL